MAALGSDSLGDSVTTPRGKDLGQELQLYDIAKQGIAGVLEDITNLKISLNRKNQADQAKADLENRLERQKLADEKARAALQQRIEREKREEIDRVSGLKDGQLDFFDSKKSSNL
jgi:hypothetical protein